MPISLFSLWILSICMMQKSNKNAQKFALIRVRVIEGIKSGLFFSTNLLLLLYGIMGLNLQFMMIYITF